MDWLTVAAQIVNFLILVGLLKRFLYRPIVTTMQARQRYVDNQLEHARQLKCQGERLIATYREKLETLERNRQEFLEQARHEAETERQALLDKARLEVEAKRLEWQQALAHEQSALLRELKLLVAGQLVELGRRALSDLAGRTLEGCIVDRFVELLHNLSEKERIQLAQCGEAIVATAFPLETGHKHQIHQALARLQPRIHVHYQERPELICGIVLESGERLWHWDLATYLDELEAQLKKALPEGVS